MGHQGSVIDGHLMNEYGQYARTAPLPIWVVSKLRMDFEELGLYSRIASAAAEEDPEKMRVTLGKPWADRLFREGGEYVELMSRLMEIGAVTKVAEYRNSGKVRLQMEPYPPDIREEVNAYRRPGGKLVAAFS